MKWGKFVKISLVLLAMCMQSMLLNRLMNSDLCNVDIQVAGEVPDPGTILLLGLGALLMRHTNRKQKRRQNDTL